MGIVMNTPSIWSQKVHEQANAYSLAAMRILFMLFWFVYLSHDNIQALKYLDWSLFHKFGISHLIPEDLWKVTHEAGLFVYLKYGLILASIWIAIGAKHARGVLIGFSIGISFYLSYTKGFGGHTNHQELTLLYCTYALIALPCFDSLSLKQNNSANNTGNASIYRASMIVLCLIVITQYVFIGLARTAIGFPGTFAPEVMETWLAQRALRPNPWEFGFVNWFVQFPELRAVIPVLLPVSTIFEVAAPVMLFLRYRWAFIFALLFAGFHLSILALMNIPFLENIAVLCVFLPIGEYLQRYFAQSETQKQKALLFFDGDCSLCHGFIRFVFKWETTENISFAPLQGDTFKEVSASGYPESLNGVDSIIFYDQKAQKFYAFSDGIILTLKSMGGLWHLPAFLLKLIPKPLRDFGYKFVAAVRFRIFGEAKDACRLPTKNERQRMLS